MFGILIPEEVGGYVRTTLRQIRLADERDVIIRLSGKVKNRKKKLSKKDGGNLHTMSLAEAKHIFYRQATLSGEGAAGLHARDRQVRILQRWIDEVLRQSELPSTPGRPR